MHTLIYSNIHSFYVERVKNFLLFKGLSFSEKSVLEEKSNANIENTEFDFGEDTFTFVFPQDKKLGKFSGKISTGSVQIMRDIEEFSPYPIGFIGPIEALFQWSLMALTSYPEISPEVLEPLFEEIEDKVEDEYFCMGPTFSVVDCVLAADLENIQKKIPLSPLLVSYITRVNQIIGKQ